MKHLDIFGSIVGLNYNGNSRYKSNFGGGLSLIMILISLATVIFFFKKFFDREIPEMTLEEQKEWNPKKIDTSNLKFSVMTKYFNRNEFHPEIFRIEAVHTKIDYKSNLKEEKILPQVPCDKNSFNDAEEQFSNLELDKGLCFDTNNTSIEGSSVNDVVEYISIKFLLCITGNECMPYDQLEEFLRKSRPVAIVYLYDSAFQPRNKNQLVKPFINFFDVVLTFYNTKFSNIYLSENQMDIEEGFFISSHKKIFKKVVLDSYRDSVSVRTDDQNNTLSINFYSSKKTQIININYMQFSTLLANIGAILGNIMILFKILVNHINHSLYEKELMEVLVTFVKNAADKKDSSTNVYLKQIIPHIVNPKYSVENINNIKSSADVRFISYNRNNNNNDMISSKRSLNTEKKKQTLKLSNANFVIYDLLICSCLRKDRKMQSVYLQMKNKMREKLEFQNVFRKLQEFDFLKYSILDSDQINLLKFGKKPILEINTNKEGTVRGFSIEEDKIYNFSDYYFKSENQLLKDERQQNNFLMKNKIFLNSFIPQDKINLPNQKNLSKKIMDTICT